MRKQIKATIPIILIASLSYSTAADAANWRKWGNRLKAAGVAAAAVVTTNNVLSARHLSPDSEEPSGDLHLEISCEDKSVDFVMAEVQLDTGNFPREDSFHLDDSVDPQCQQSSTATYSKKISGDTPYSYDRGHLAPANLFDYSSEAIRASNNMLNIVPQISVTNRKGGAWFETEMALECQRNAKFIGDDRGITLIVGAIWNDPSNDYFVKSHGIKTPESLFKVIIYHQPEGDSIVSWNIPNTRPVKAAELDSHLTTVEDIVASGGSNKLKEVVPEHLFSAKPSNVPRVPSQCDFS